MAVIVYRCRVCNREVELQEQPRGLEVINRCIITDSCRGTLYRVDRKENFLTGSFPDPVPGLTDYVQRNVLYNHEQIIDEESWLIVHNLGSNPSVQTFVDRSEQVNDEVVDTLQEVEPQRIEIIDENSLRVFFDRPESGRAQLLARTTSPDKLFAEPVPEDSADFVQVSNNGVLTVAFLEEGSPSFATLEQLTLRYVVGNQTQILAQTTTIDVTYNAQFPAISTSPWNDAEVVVVDGIRYVVRSIATGNPVVDSGVTNGTTVFFDQNVADNLILLLASPPFGNIDKDRRRLFRPAFTQGPTQRLNAFVIRNGEFFIQRTIIEEIFPPIYIVD